MAPKYRRTRLWVDPPFQLRLLARMGCYLLVYVLIALPFALVWGLKVDEWALIDLVSATLIGLSAIFLRTELSQRGGA